MNDPMERLQKMMAISYENTACVSEDECATTKSKESAGGLVNSIISDFGGFSIAMGAMKTATACSTKLFPNNEKYQKFSRFMEGAMPVAMTLHRVGVTINDRIKRHLKKDKPHIDEERLILSSMLDIDTSKSYLQNIPMDKKASSSTDWLMSMPNTSIIETLGVLDWKFDVIENRREIDNLRKAYYMYRMTNGIQFFVMVDKDLFGEKILSRRMFIDGTVCYDAIRMMVTYAYIDSLKFKENIITIRGNDDITSSRRKTVDHDVYQLSPDFLSEIRNSIKKGKKRGYALAGVPGTGKTTVVDKIVDEIRDVPVLYIPADQNDGAHRILASLMVCQMVAPCIVVIEDIDSLPLNHKHSEFLNMFIEYLDSAKYDAPIIFIATMNEPENVHESLMDRRGRFDKVLVVDPPKNREEVIDVFGNIYMRELGVEMPKDILSDSFYEIAAKGDLRHSDFAEVINRVTINEMPIVPESFTKVLKDICDTQNYVNKFKNRNRRKRHEDRKEDIGEDEEVPVSYGKISTNYIEDVSDHDDYEKEKECEKWSDAIGVGVGL